MKEILKNVKKKLTSKYLESTDPKSTKKFKPRIKARIRKNRQVLNKNIENFFDFILFFKYI